MSDPSIRLRERARSYKPNVETQPNELLCAVLRHDRDVETAKAIDFVWFKVKTTTTLLKVKKQYVKKISCMVDLKHGASFPADTAKVGWLELFDDTLVVFRAIESNGQQDINNANHTSRTPLQEKNAQAISKPQTVLEKSPKANSRESPKTPRIQKALSNSGSATTLFGGSQNNKPKPHSESQGPKLEPLESKALSLLLNGIRGSKEDSYHRADPATMHSFSQETMYAMYGRVPILNSTLIPTAKASSTARLSDQVEKKEYDSPFSPIEYEERPIKSEGDSITSLFRSLPDPHNGSFENPTTPLPESNLSAIVSIKNDRLPNLMADATPETLEAEVERNMSLLSKLKDPMSRLGAHNEQARQWLEQIGNVEKQNKPQRTIIGVVGNTGAGKSSVINAMLDEERLVPTNCMRACTAVVTELSWNNSEDETAKYRAAIEFIKPEDWEKELSILFEELLDGSGNVSKEASNADSEAGIAYAKIKAVYPNLTKEDIANSSITQLMRHNVVKKVLGTTKEVNEAQSDKFYRRLQHFVDSKEKQTDDKKATKELEYWPLIKVVKIYVKSDALSTGAVIVDLPGVHDSNAARSAVAQNYMKQCTGLWICAPITRAVDDKAAKSLLGESFKRQLKYDGTYSRVTFICSKTDDISITEATDSLGLHDQMSSKWDILDQIEEDQKRLKDQLSELKDSKEAYGEILNDTDDKIEIWDDLRDSIEDGKTVFAPSSGSKKRKKSSSSKQRKRRKGSDSDDSDSMADDDSSTNEDEETSSSRGEPLTIETITSTIAGLKETKKDARRHRRDIDTQITDIKEEIKILTAEDKVIEAEMSSICIAGRNGYSKGAIQQDFAAGIKELDQENHAEEDEENFNPEDDIRDYDEVARSLPVFCVSSRAYQKLSGRLQRDKAVPGFYKLDQTEIPQLQVHCKKLTEAGREACCRRFLNSFGQLLTSLSMWTAIDGSNIKLSSTEIALEARFLHSKLAQLERGLEKAVQDCLAEMKESLSENIYEKFGQVVQSAADAANDTASKWGAPVNRENRALGGLHWSSYKAIVRRNGVYSNKQGLHDFNSQLTEPIMKQLASHWEKAFARRLPNVLQGFTKSVKALLHKFHRDIEARTMQRGTTIAGLAMLGQQLSNYERTFQDLTAQLLEIINANQRDANREFTPVIAEKLASAYTWCANEHGSGSFMRMKSHMQDHVDQQRQTMFYDSTEEVKKRLNQMCRTVEEGMANNTDVVFTQMRRDYLTVITGQSQQEGNNMPKWVRTIMSDIAETIDKHEGRGKYDGEEDLDSDRAKDTDELSEMKPEVTEGSPSDDPFDAENTVAGADIVRSADIPLKRDNSPDLNMEH